MFLTGKSVHFAFVARSSENPRNILVPVFKELLLIEGRLLRLCTGRVGGDMYR